MADEERAMAERANKAHAERIEAAAAKMREKERQEEVAEMDLDGKVLIQFLGGGTITGTVTQVQMGCHDPFRLKFLTENGETVYIPWHGIATHRKVN